MVIKIYLDGVFKSSNPDTTVGSISSTNNGFDIGDRSNGSFPFNGSVDEFGIWKRALTSAEISSLYNSGNGLKYPF
jgi:hypothetical protein